MSESLRVGSRPFMFKTEALRGADWEAGVMALTELFGLRKMGTRKTTPWGFVRLPSSVSSLGIPGARRRMYMARFEPDLEAIRRWGLD